MTSFLSSQNLDLITSFFEERIEAVQLKSGDTVFIQRPMEKTESSVQSAGAALPDDFNINNILANNVLIFRVNIGPLNIVVKYDPVKLWVTIIVTLVVPILGRVEVGRASGSLKHGVPVRINYRGFVCGEVGGGLGGNSITLYWDFTAFGRSYRDEVVIFNIY